MRGMTQEEYAVLSGKHYSESGNRNLSLRGAADRLLERGCFRPEPVEGTGFIDFRRTELGEVARKLGPQILCDSGPGAGE
jgi:hypothetical protein